MKTMNDICVLIQSRLGSTRLPHKVMLPIQNLCVLDHVVNRCKRAKSLNKVIVCTTDLPEDDLIYNHCLENNIPCHRGSSKNVLSRYHGAAVKFQCSHVIRVTSDCPLIDPEIIDDMVKFFFKNKLTYLGPKYYGNHNFPDGFNVEIFKFSVLDEAHKHAKDLYELEHVTPYIINKYSNLEYNYPLDIQLNKLDLSKLHLSLDTYADYLNILNIYNNLYPDNNNFTMKDVLLFLENLL